MKHTQEPWPDYNNIQSNDVNSNASIKRQFPNYVLIHRDNYDRAMSCVNALAGIENPQEWVKERQWVSVEERLPGKAEGYNCSKIVLVTDGSANSFSETYLDKAFYDFKANKWSCKNMTVTHWMLLPEKPKP